ncbi:MAG: hypothetical protein NC187_03815 [Candidatus Amulumruptor caecigallinarius]|nr:hypothetical protein [Candidatus Amulumruptor caecigallinarius]MCM1396599.1 hypothetical protein [Candidatus Amulumruptor caecigallinarius]MCM1453343.1 hypothetical protein [bacterium]
MKKFLLSALAAVMSVSAAYADDAASDVQVLIDTDFTVFTEGSEQSPKSLYSYTFNSKVAGYYGISGVSAAGGKILVGPSGYLQLNQFADLPTGGGTIRVTMEVKMLDNYGGAIQLTRGYSSTDIVYEAVETDEWTTVSVLCGGYTNTSSSRLKVQPFLSISGFYLKSLKVEYSADFIVAPEAYLPSDADGTSFTASCSRVTGASGYEADVYSLGTDGKPVYAEQNVALTAISSYANPSAKITGLDPATTYYFVARALNADGKKSDDSEAVQVIKSITSIDAPVALPASNVSDGGFTANWETVADAKGYLINVYEKQTLAQDTEASVFAEDFSGVNVGTIANIEYSGQLDDFTVVPGWETESGTKAFAAGYFVFYPTSEGTLTTPAIDLSADDGVFTVTLSGFTGKYGNMTATENTLKAELLVDGEVVETANTYICDKSAPHDFIFNFTKGTSDSRVRFTYTLESGSYDKLYVDAIDIKQMLPAGTEIKKQIATGSAAAPATSADIELTPESGKTYYYSVIALAQTVTGTGATAAVGELQSKESNLIEISFSSASISEVAAEAAAPAAWKAAPGILGVSGVKVAVYDLTGRVLYNGAAAPAIDLGVNGVVIVNVDGVTVKVAL